MRQIFLFLAFIALLGWGCQRGYEFPEALKKDVANLRQQVLCPSVDSVRYANRLCREIASLPDAKERLVCQKEMEEVLYLIRIESPNLRERYFQFCHFSDIADSLSFCILQSGGTEEDYWDSCSRLLKWMQVRLSCLDPPVAISPDDHRPRSSQELMRDSYWDMFHEAFGAHVRHLEENFNDKTCSRVSPARQQVIRQKIERVLGRRIRTNKEIQDQLRAQRKHLREKLGL